MQLLLKQQQHLGIVKGIETGNVKEAVKKGMLVGSEGFKWGAISGAVKGGIGEAMALKGATLNGLTMNEAATIQKESGYPLDVIKKLHSMDEYNIYKKANLIPEQIDGHIALSREIDLTTVQKDGMTNAERIAKGLSPYDPNGGKYQLHHIGQDDNSPLAILEQSEHQGTGNNSGNYSILNFKEVSDVDHGEKWANVVDNFWKAYVKNHSGG